MDGALKKVVPTSLQAHPLYQSEYLTLAGHPGEGHMSGTDENGIFLAVYRKRRVYDRKELSQMCPEQAR